MKNLLDAVLEERIRFQLGRIFCFSHCNLIFSYKWIQALYKSTLLNLNAGFSKKKKNTQAMWLFCFDSASVNQK